MGFAAEAHSVSFRIVNFKLISVSFRALYCPKLGSSLSSGEKAFPLPRQTAMAICMAQGPLR